MKFKRIYIEISNVCNLRCSFCRRDNREKRVMTSREFEEVIKKIDKYTDYIYLHVKGEPLIHPELDAILGISRKYNKKVCITTNGVLLKEKIDILKKYDNIYQVNISLHSENNKNNYLENIFEVIKEIDSYISLRFWTLDDRKIDNRTREILDKIKKRYGKEEITNGMKLDNKVYLSLDEEFEWPSLDSDYESDGYCLGGQMQIAILSDGTVSVCCLDSEGKSNLGNIFDDSLDNILNTEKYKRVVEEFRNNRCYLEICKHCSYKERFKKEKIGVNN